MPCRRLQVLLRRIAVTAARPTRSAVTAPGRLTQVVLAWSGSSRPLVVRRVPAARRAPSSRCAGEALDHLHLDLATAGGRGSGAPEPATQGTVHRHHVTGCQPAGRPPRRGPPGHAVQGVDRDHPRAGCGRTAPSGPVHDQPPRRDDVAARQRPLLRRGRNSPTSVTSFRVSSTCGRGLSWSPSPSPSPDGDSAFSRRPTATAHLLLPPGRAPGTGSTCCTGAGCRRSRAGLWTSRDAVHARPGRAATTATERRPPRPPGRAAWRR